MYINSEPEVKKPHPVHNIRRTILGPNPTVWAEPLNEKNNNKKSKRSFTRIPKTTKNL
jgi:hypothetical protein